MVLKNYLYQGTEWCLGTAPGGKRKDRQPFQHSNPAWGHNYSNSRVVRPQKRDCGPKKGRRYTAVDAKKKSKRSDTLRPTAVGKKQAVIAQSALLP